MLVWAAPVAGESVRTSLAAQRPRLRRFRHRQRAHEITQVVGQRMELKTRRIGSGGPAGQSHHLIAPLPTLMYGFAVPRWWPRSSGIRARFTLASASSSPTWRGLPSASSPSTELADKLTRRRKFDDLARLGRIGVERVTVAGDQIAARREHQSQRPTQMIIPEDDGDGATRRRAGSAASVGNRKDRIVGR
jgi:hypothetical protein